MTSTNRNPAPERLMKLATACSLAVAGLLIVIKTAAWWVTGSLSMLSSLVDSLLDITSSLVNFVAVRYALMPPDEDHRFGHGKAEDIAALAQAAFIAGSGIFIAAAAIKRLFEPEPLHQEWVGMVVMVVSIALTLLLVTFQRYVVRQTASTVVRADSVHYLSDLLTNSAVLVALGLAHFAGWQLADPLFALGISAYILYSAWSVGITAFHHLMDREFEDADRERIETLVRRQPGVLGLHDLKTRRSGLNRFIQFHLDLDENLSLRAAHEISDSVERELMAAFPNTEIIIHEDPINPDLLSRGIVQHA